MYKVIRVGALLNIAIVLLSYEVYANILCIVAAMIVSFVASIESTDSAMKDIKEDVYGSAKKWSDVWFTTFTVCFINFLMAFFNIWIMIKKYPFIYTGGELHYRQNDTLLIAGSGMILVVLLLYLVMIFASICCLVTAIKPHSVFGDKILD